MAGSGLARFGSAYFLLAVLVVLFVAFSFLAPNTFPTSFNLQTMGTSKSIVALLALAVMVPIAANEFDLLSATRSVSSTSSRWASRYSWECRGTWPR